MKLKPNISKNTALTLSWN